MESRAAPLRHSDGTTVQLAITRTVTDYRLDERAAMLLGAIVNSSDDAIISKDLNGIITSWNISAERLFGYTSEEAVGQPVTILIPPDRLDEEPKILSRLRRGERVDHFETIRMRKDRTPLNISLTISPVKDRQGNIIGVSKIARDITERKRAEAALLESEGRFQQLADAMPQIVWTTRADGQTDYFNARWYEFTGFSRDVLGDDRAGCQSSIPTTQRVPAKHGMTPSVPVNPSASSTVFWDRHDRRWRWFMGRALPVRDADGNIVKWFGSSTDIDAQKRVEDDLSSANQDLEQFAHFRQPRLAGAFAQRQDLQRTPDRYLSAQT